MTGYQSDLVLVMIFAILVYLLVRSLAREQKSKLEQQRLKEDADRREAELRAQMPMEQLLQSNRSASPRALAELILRKVVFPRDPGSSISLRRLKKPYVSEQIKKDDLAALVAALDDPCETVREAASMGLILLGPSTVEACKVVSRDGSQRAQLGALKVLASYGHFSPTGWPQFAGPTSPGIGELHIANQSDYRLRVAILEYDVAGRFMNRGEDAWVDEYGVFVLQYDSKYMICFYDCGDPLHRYTTQEYIRIPFREIVRIAFPSRSDSGIRIGRSSAV